MSVPAAWAGTSFDILYFPTARGSPRSRDSIRSQHQIQKSSGASKRRDEPSYEAKLLLISPRETLFAVRLVITPSELLERSSGSQTIFAIVKDIQILYLRNSLSSSGKHNVLLEVEARSHRRSVQNGPKNEGYVALIYCNKT